jgi:GNAT superfamily N-acetyltransferase
LRHDFLPFLVVDVAGRREKNFKKMSCANEALLFSGSNKISSMRTLHQIVARADIVVPTMRCVNLAFLTEPANASPLDLDTAWYANMRDNRSSAVQEIVMLILRAVDVSELESLSTLCLRSKAVWGYDQAFMDACRAELTLTAEDVSETDLQVAERDGKVEGLAQISVDGARAHLEKLFVEPDALRGGIGRVLFEWAAAQARDRGAKVLIIEADPDAAPFYRRMGAYDDGVAASGSIPGRVLPRLKFDLA